MKDLVSLSAGEFIAGEDIRDGGEFPVFGGNGLRGYAPRFTHSGQQVLIGRQGALCGNVHLVEGPVWVTEHALVAKPVRPLDLRWLAYILTAMNLRQYSVTAAQPGIAAGAIANLDIPVPPAEEQSRLASFLDRQVGLIDGVVGQREQQVSLLREYVVASESKLVWQGPAPCDLDEAPISQVGTTPKSWRWVRNKNLLVEVRELSLDGSEELLSVSHITGVTRRSDKNVNMFLAETNEGYLKVRPSDLVINTMWAWMGALGVSPREGIVSPAYGVYRSRTLESFEPDYYDALYRSPAYVSEMMRYSTGVWSSRLRIYPEVFLSLPVVVPSADEQRAIAKRIREVRDSIVPTTALLEQSIDLLHERKQTLITAAVTGDLDPSTMSDRAGKIAIA